MASFNFDEKKLLKAIEDRTEQEFRRRVESLRCSEHGERPTLKRTGRSSEGPTFQVSACCEPMRERAKKALAGK